MFYLWSQRSPLADYRGLSGKKDSVASYYKNWVSLSVLYSDYGSWLIKQHPLGYAQYYCWPNLQRYAFPPLEFMGRYNSGMDTVDRLAVSWFHYKDQRVHVSSPTIQASILAPYQILNMLLNLFLLGMFSLFLITKGARKADPLFSRQMMMAGSAWVLHFGFSILAAPVVLRYQVFPMILGGACSLLLAEHLLKGEMQLSGKKIITECCAFCLVFLFVYTATAKLFRFQLFRYQLDRYPWIRHMGGLIVWGLPLLELTIAALLISGRKRLTGFYAAFGLMAVLTAYLVLMLGTEKHLPCSCGGVIEGLTWRQHVVFNLFFLIMAGLGIKLVRSFTFSSPLKL
jgi:hypothetical protein